MGHEHEAIIQLNNTIKCRTCGKIAPYAEETICRVDSAVRARRIMEEIAVAGGYWASSLVSGFVVYKREQGGLTIEITAEKMSDRKYKVYKRLISKGGGI